MLSEREKTSLQSQNRLIVLIYFPHEFRSHLLVTQPKWATTEKKTLEWKKLEIFFISIQNETCF